MPINYPDLTEAFLTWEELYSPFLEMKNADEAVQYIAQLANYSHAKGINIWLAKSRHQEEAIKFLESKGMRYRIDSEVLRALLLK